MTVHSIPDQDMKLLNFTYRTGGAFWSRVNNCPSRAFWISSSVLGSPKGRPEGRIVCSADDFPLRRMLYRAGPLGVSVLFRAGRTSSITSDTWCTGTISTVNFRRSSSFSRL